MKYQIRAALAHTLGQNKQPVTEAELKELAEEAFSHPGLHVVTLCLRDPSNPIKVSHSPFGNGRFFQMAKNLSELRPQWVFAFDMQTRGQHYRIYIENGRGYVSEGQVAYPPFEEARLSESF